MDYKCRNVKSRNNMKHYPHLCEMTILRYKFKKNKIKCCVFFLTYSVPFAKSR